MGRKRVLVVEPVGFLRWAFVKHLRAAGHEVEEARDGPEALRKAPFGFHLVLLDLESSAAASEVKRLAPGCRLVVMAAHDSLIFRSQAREAGADDFLPKPREVPRIAAAVERFLPSTV